MVTDLIAGPCEPRKTAFSLARFQGLEILLEENGSFVNREIEQGGMPRFYAFLYGRMTENGP
jgi:hypothetical protein